MENEEQHSPLTYTAGYPTAVYYFTGEWASCTQGVKRAVRNRTKIMVPVYKDDLGNEILVMCFWRAAKQRGEQ